MSVLRDELRRIDKGRKALRSFGLLIGGIVLLIAAAMLWNAGGAPGPASYAVGTFGAVLMGLGLTRPTMLKSVYVVWMGFAIVLGFVMTRVLLTAVFCLAVTPTALILRALGKDPLRRKLDPDVSTYWIPKVYDDPSPSRLEKYY